MCALIRPTSIHDFSDDPTLETSPIGKSLPPKDHLHVGVITLMFYAGLGVVALFSPYLFRGLGDPLLAPEPYPTPSSIGIVLREVIPAPLTKEKIRLGSNSLRGGGGTGTIDPGLVTKVVPNIPVNVEPLDNLQGLAYPRAPVIAGDPTLPLARGGNGLELGTGEGVSGRSDGNGLVPIYTPRIKYSLTQSQMAQEGDIVLVKITIQSDGHVSRARAVSGPTFLFSAAEAMALKWRFEPLTQHGLKGPVESSIRFVCSIAK